MASGTVSMEANKWQNLKLVTKGSEINAFINGVEVAKKINVNFPYGMAELGGSYNKIDFDNFAIAEPSYIPKEKLLVLNLNWIILIGN